MHLDISDEQVLDNAGIRVTAVRLLIWRKVRHDFSDAFSLADIEAALPTIDRSTIFRMVLTMVLVLRSIASAISTTPATVMAMSTSLVASVIAPIVLTMSASLPYPFLPASR